MAIVPQLLTSSTCYVMNLATNIHFSLSSMHCAMANNATKIAERPILCISASCHIWHFILRKIAIFGFVLRYSAILSLILLYLSLLVIDFALQSLYFTLHCL